MPLTFDPRFGLSQAEVVVSALRIPQYVAELRHHTSLADQREGYQRTVANYDLARKALQSVRSKGYLWFPSIEQSFRAAQLKALGLAPSLANALDGKAANALATLDAAAAQVQALGNAIRTPALAGAVVQQFNAAAALIAETTQAIDNALDDLTTAVNHLRGLVSAIEGVLSRFAATQIQLAPGEQLILAVEAKWDDAPSGEQKGALVLTTQRILFFQDEQQTIAGRWFAREKVTVRDVSLERPLSAIASVRGGTEGWVFKDQVLHIEFMAGSGDPNSCAIEVKNGDSLSLPEEFDESTEWSAMIQRIKGGAPVELARLEDSRTLPDLPAYEHSSPPDAARAPAAPQPAAQQPSAQQPAPPIFQQPPTVEQPPPVEPPPPVAQPAAPVELPWLEVELSLSPDSYLTVAVPGSSFGQQLPPLELRQVRWNTLNDFSNALQALAHEGVDLTPDARKLAWQLFSAVFSGRVSGALNLGRGMAAAKRSQLLVRLMISNPELRAVPWEVMCGPDDESEFLAHHQELQVVRGLYSARATLPSVAVARPRALVIAPGELGDDGEQLTAILRRSASEHWVIEEPLLGPNATWNELTKRLQSTPDLALLHVLAHGRVRDGVPEVKLAGHGAEWTPAELVANALAKPARQGLRLVYLESCASADSGELASAGERIAAAGVPAVIAQLWPVSVRGARVVATRFYETLLSLRGGDVAEALDAARLCAAGNLRSAEFLCPVLFLRGDDPRVLSGYAR